MKSDNMIAEILKKSSSHGLEMFKSEEIEWLGNRIELKKTKAGIGYYADCFVRGKNIKMTPEEVVRQLYAHRLVEDYGYDIGRLAFEFPIFFGREAKRADIVIRDKEDLNVPYIIVETKKPNAKDGREQLKSYTHATGASMAVWTNGTTITYHQRKNPNFFEDIPGIPTADKTLGDILRKKFTIDDLVKEDKLTKTGKSLKDLILEMEDEVLANAGVDVFEEVFKLVFAKLYDEKRGTRYPDNDLEFRNSGQSDIQLKDKIEKLFKKACNEWPGVFPDDAKISLTPPHLSICVASLETVKLFNSNLDVVDEAFEYLINKSSKGEKGQYFTPRYVIDMCVRMLNPSANETMIDTAAGSCGFPVHTIFYVWQKILESKGLKKSHLFTLEQKPQECTDYVQSKVFAIDFDEKAVRVARTLNLIAGDGQTNVLHLNTLDYERWDENLKDENWQETYFNGWNKLKKMRTNKSSNRDFQFDILMANPPFAGDIKESRILSKYELSKNAAGKMASKVGRDILFIERNLDFLKPGGRMAIVLPQGRFNNSSDKYIRDYIAERCRILAVVGLHGNVFKPHTGTKTSVLFVQKWDDVLCPKKEDYPIFFATMQEPSKDNSGEKIFVKKGDYPRSAKPTDGQNEWMVSDVVAHYEVTPKENNEYLLDSHGHLIVKHDLFNHDGLTRDGIAEAFAEFAKKEGLSFF